MPDLHDHIDLLDWLLNCYPSVDEVYRTGQTLFVTGEIEDETFNLFSVLTWKPELHSHHAAIQVELRDLKRNTAYYQQLICDYLINMVITIEGEPSLIINTTEDTAEWNARRVGFDNWAALASIIRQGPLVDELTTEATDDRRLEINAMQREAKENMRKAAQISLRAKYRLAS